MKLAVIGATGLVGREILKVLEERMIQPDFFIPVASPKSVGKPIFFQGKEYRVAGHTEAVSAAPDFAIFSAGAGTSRDWAPKYAAAGITVIDNSSAWRMEDHVPLIVPEINGGILRAEDKIISNPNCSAIQMVLVLAPLHEKYRIRRVVVSTYQSVTGTGAKAVRQLESERKGEQSEKAYPYPIDLNILPHGGNFMENGYTTEEVKLENETRKILNDYSIAVTATVVRVPIFVGHSEAVNIEFENEFDLQAVRDLLSQSNGVVLQDDPAKNIYPIPLYAQGKDEVFVGRIRRDESQPASLNLFIVADNLRKGAATNAVQIMQFLIDKKFAS